MSVEQRFETAFERYVYCNRLGWLPGNPDFLFRILQELVFS